MYQKIVGAVPLPRGVLTKFWHILTTIPPLFDGLLLHNSQQGEGMQLSDIVDEL